MKASYWSDRYQNNKTGWDLGQVSKPLLPIFKTLNVNDKILIPGCGNAHEARFLHSQGFNDVHIIDIVKEPLVNFTNAHPNFPKNKVIHGDFFEHTANYDVIIEQTFFCAIDPCLRIDYVKKCAELLRANGVLTGVLFNREFPEGPPFGGNKEEYKKLFLKGFKQVEIRECHNSSEPRLGTEVLIKCSNQNTFS